MVSPYSIVVEKLTERFRVSSDRPPTLKERLSTLRRSHFRTFEALCDISMSVRHGESVGIIGHNGSGKSTLLKCMAGILPADEGRVDVSGRIATLLELGAGFHPDLSGRENVYLNGAILGLRRAEIDAAFDDIVDFAGVRDFIDAPIRTYSSGMYVRLGFAIAVHVDPDVLLVDEVLSVGDAAFQERSLARMRSFIQRGRTVVLVSHDLGAIRALCARTVVLDHGRLVFDGATEDAIEHYSDLVAGRASVSATPGTPPDRTGDGRARVGEVRLLLDGRPADAAQPLPSGATVQVVLPFSASEEIIDAGSLSAGIAVRRPDVQRYVYETRTSWRGTYLAPPRPGATATLTFTLDLAVLDGDYVIDLLIANAATNVVHDRWQGALALRVVSPEHEFGIARLDARIGVWNPDGAWPPELHAPALDRGGPREHPLREDLPSPGYEPDVPRVQVTTPS